MSKLIIRDLAASKDLDKAAATKICGGLFNPGQFVARQKAPHLPSARLPGNIYNIVNNTYNTFNGNPMFLSVNNGDGNTGTIGNNINIFSLTAASPAVIG
jgi:hypothetical protein